MISRSSSVSSATMAVAVRGGIEVLSLGALGALLAGLLPDLARFAAITSSNDNTLKSALFLEGDVLSAASRAVAVRLLSAVPFPALPEAPLLPVRRFRAISAT